LAAPSAIFSALGIRANALLLGTGMQQLYAMDFQLVMDTHCFSCAARLGISRWCCISWHIHTEEHEGIGRL